MQREYKFRAWDKKEKTMNYSGSDNFYYMEFCEGVRVLGCHNIGGDPDTEIKSFELMMFTGLRDKNGKEIYEGDIVENKHCIYPNRAECYFEDGSFQFKASGCNQCDDFLANNLTTEFEVIGNVYQDSYLLKGAK